MTHAGTRIKRAAQTSERGVNAAVVVLHEAKALEKVTGDKRGSVRISAAFQFIAMAALEQGLTMNDVLNACSDVTAWSLTHAFGGPGAERWAAFSGLSADVLARADEHWEIIKLDGTPTEGNA